MVNKKQHTDIYGDTRKLNRLPFLLGGDGINKREKEAQQVFLDNEKAILKQLEQNYEDALAEINDKIAILMAREDAELQHVIYQINYQKALKKQVSAILDKLHANEYESISEYLAKSYEDGFITTMYNLQGQGIPLVIPIDQQQVIEAIQTDSKISTDLYTALGKDISKLKKQISGEISRGISNAAMYSEIAKNLSSYARIGKNNAHRIVRTEMHRIQNKAAMDAQWKAKANGADVVKQWDAALDKRTRDSHAKVDGEIRELDEEFSNGLMFPGDPSGRPEEVINCRCALLQRARWNLGSDYTKWSEDAPIEIADDGTSQLAYIKAKNYKDFKEKYSQASERVRSNVQKMKPLEKSGKSSTIKVNKVISGHSSTPKQTDANSIIDHVDKDGNVDVRSFYGDDGMKQKDIHTNDHGNPKWHDYGEHGEHGHDYEWNDDGRLKNKTTRELSKDERKENGDIL